MNEKEIVLLQRVNNRTHVIEIFFFGKRDFAPLLISVGMIKTLNAFHNSIVSICSEEDIDFASLLASCMTVSRDLEILHLIVSLCSQAEAQNCLFGKKV